MPATPRVTFRRAIALVLGANALVSSAALQAVDGTDAQPAPGVPRSTYIEKGVSELVLIETYASDGRGKPVTGLTKDDFILEVGGLRRPIFSVDFPEAGSSAVPTVGGTPTREGAWPRRVVLFFEDNTSSPIGLTEARIAASRFLESGLAPSDEVALAAYDQRLRILAPFTTDRPLLRKAIAASMKDSVRISNFWQEAAQHWQELARNPQPMLAQALCEDEKARLAGALNALQTVVASLAGWRGYKAVVYMGNGVPESPMEDAWKIFALIEARYPGAIPPFFPMRCTLADEIKDLSRAASAAGVTIHSVQTWGLTAVPAGGQRMVSRRSNALETLALNTAGTSTATNNLLLALQQIEAASRVYYLLAYVPQEPADGRYRHVVVRCRRKGVQLRYRRGFTRLPPDEARTQVIESAYLFPEMSTNLGMEIEVAEGPGDGTDRVVDIVVHLPLGKILFLPQQEGATAHLTVGLVALDDTQRRTFETSRSVTIRRPTADKGVTGLDLYCRARLPYASQTITTVISDEQAGTVGGTRDRIAAHPSPGPAAHGLSLYSLAEQSLWIEVPPAPAGKGGEMAATEYTIGPALKTTFVAGEPIVAGFRFAPLEVDAPAALRVEISRGDDLVRSRTVDIVPDGLVGTTKVPLSLEGLASGEYVVSIYAILADRDAKIGARTFRIVEADSRPGF
jgi:VWFA-related protein